MKTPLRLLIVEDSESDAELILRQLKKAEYSVDFERVETAKDMKAALETKTWDLIISDYKLPRFNAPAALALFKKTKIDIPFIVISGTIGEEIAVELMKAGAHDYLMKNKLARLAPVVKRELTDAQMRRAHKKVEEESLLLAQAVKSTRDCISITDMENNILFVNDSFITTYGYSEDELIGKNISFIRSPIVSSETGKAVLLGTMKKGWHGEILNRRKDGSDFTVELWTSVVRNNSGNPIAMVGIARDKTEQKHAEEEIKKREKKFKQMFDDAPLGYHELDAKGCITNINRMELDMLGYSADEMIGVPVWKFNADPETARKRVLAKLAGTVPCDKQVVRNNSKKDGTSFPVLVEDALLKDEKGNITGIRTIVQDITERKRTEAELQKSEAQLANAVKLAKLGSWEYDVENDLFTFNDSFYAIFRTTAKQVGGYTMSSAQYSKQFVYHDDLPIVKERIRKTIKNTDTNDDCQLEHRILFANGEIGYIAVRILDVKDAKGRTIKTFGVNQDITERKKAEIALRENEEFFRLLFTTLPDSIILFNPHSTTVPWEIIDCNEASCRMHGFTREEILGKSVDIFLVKPTTLEEREAHLKLLQQNDVTYFETLHRYRDGRIFPIEVSSSIVVVGGRQLILGIDRDITQRKQAEEKIHKSEEQFRTLFMSMSQGFYLSDIIYDAKGNPCDYRYVEVNPTFEKMLGLSRNEIIGKRYKELVPLDTTQWLENYCKIASTGKPLTYEFYSDEYQKYFETYSYKPNKDQVTVIVADITERKYAEKALQESQALYRSFVDHLPAGVFRKDGEGRFIFVNSLFCQLKGLNEDDILGKTPRELAEYESSIRNSRPQEMNGLQRTLAEQGSDHHKLIMQTGKPIEIDEIYPQPDGTTKYYHVVKSPVFSSEGKIVGSQGVQFDITERMQSGEKLLESEERYRRLVEFSPDAIAVHSEGKIVYVNPATVTLLGANSASELIGKSFLDIIHPDYRESIHQQIIAVMREEYAIPLTEQKFLRLDGTVVDVEVAALPILYKEKTAMQIVVRDISEHKKLQNQLLQTQKIQSIGTLAGGIAHDFNNILGIILAYSSLLDKNKLTPDKFAVSITAINQAVQRGAALVRQILTFARKTDIVFEAMDISELIHELLSMLEQTFPKTITFSKNIASSLPLIFADRTQVHQALLNLCINARDAMPHGGSISIAVEKQTKEQIVQQFPTANEEEYLCLTVTDTGNGMDEATCLRVFDPFFTTKEKGKGTGLGLSVVYGVVQAHHGFIDLKSKPDIGTTFRLYFPVPVINEQSADSQQLIEPFDIGGTETILFVEDEELLIQMVSLLLESKGYSVICARDGLEAVNVYQSQKQKIELVITDMGLPVMTGTDEFKKLKELDPKVKVIFASGYFEPDVKSELLKDGAMGFIQKPYEPNDILRIIRNVLDQKG